MRSRRTGSPYRCTVPIPDTLQQFLERQHVSDGFAPLSEAKMAVLGNPERWMMIADDDDVVAVGVVATHRQPDSTVHWTVETAVDRAMRFPAFEDRVVSETLTLVPGDASFSAWSRRASLDSSLGRSGFVPVRSLAEMAVTLPIAIDPIQNPPEFEVRSFTEGDVDTLVEINAAAFASHREAGSLDRDQVGSLMEEGWFDADGLLFHEVGGVVAGFCWTKVHGNGEGEIYRIGVDPQFHGAGIGRRIVLAGFEHLEMKRGCTTGFLWVDEANEPAVGLYSGIGLRARSHNREFALPSTVQDAR